MLKEAHEALMSANAWLMSRLRTIEVSDPNESFLAIRWASISPAKPAGRGFLSQNLSHLAPIEYCLVLRHLSTRWRPPPINAVPIQYPFRGKDGATCG